MNRKGKLMMITGRLLELAFEYKKQKLWKELLESEVLGISMDDGAAGYITILGQNGEHNALVLYMGESGAACLYRLTHANFMFLSEREFREIAMSNDCIQCALESKGMLFDDEREQVRAYAKAHGIRLAGKNAFPHFVRYRPDHIPWRLTDPAEQHYLEQALEAALYIADILKNPQSQAEREEAQRLLDFLESGDVPCFRKENDQWVMDEERMESPVDYHPEYPVPSIANELLLARLKRKKQSGRLLIDVVRFVEAVQEDSEAPYFPYFIMALDPGTDTLVETKQTRHLERGAQILLEDFTQALIDRGGYPKEILVMNDRSEAFLKEFCRSMKIRLTRKDSLPELEEAEDGFLETFRNVGTEDMDFMADLLDSFTDEEILGMPDEVRTQVVDLIDAGLLPDRLAARLAGLLGFPL